jgi:hypothetical protein
MPINENDINTMKSLFPYIREYQKLANKYKIEDVFQDNGGKILQMFLFTGLSPLGGREGNDARDDSGQEYELKSVNVKLTKSFSTHHHLNHDIIAKYRQVPWIFAVYEDIEIRKIYRVEKQAMEIWYTKWEKQLRNNGEMPLNNPKIPLTFVESNGTLLFDYIQAPF